MRQAAWVPRRHVLERPDGPGEVSMQEGAEKL